jgi:hypothetical protein
VCEEIEKGSHDLQSSLQGGPHYDLEQLREVVYEAHRKVQGSFKDQHDYLRHHG